MHYFKYYDYLTKNVNELISKGQNLLEIPEYICVTFIIWWICSLSWGLVATVLSCSCWFFKAPAIIFKRGKMAVLRPNYAEMI
jgi:hypothetical protein